MGFQRMQFHKTVCLNVCNFTKVTLVGLKLQPIASSWRIWIFKASVLKTIQFRIQAKIDELDNEVHRQIKFINFWICGSLILQILVYFNELSPAELDLILSTPQ